MAATWDTIDRYVVISTDTHAGADLYDYKQYLPTRLHDDFDAWAKTYVSPFDDLIVATAQRNWDHEMRMSEMDADGVAAEVLLPNTDAAVLPDHTRTSPSACRAPVRSSNSDGRVCRPTTAGRSTSARWRRSGAAD